MRVSHRRRARRRDPQQGPHRQCARLPPARRHLDPARPSKTRPDWVLRELQKPRDYTADLLKLLASPNICDKRYIYEQYDSMVQTNTVQGPGFEAGVIRIKGTGSAPPQHAIKTRRHPPPPPPQAEDLLPSRSAPTRSPRPKLPPPSSPPPTISTPSPSTTASRASSSTSSPAPPPRAKRPSRRAAKTPPTPS